MFSCLSRFKLRYSKSHDCSHREHNHYRFQRSHDDPMEPSTSEVLTNDAYPKKISVVTTSSETPRFHWIPTKEEKELLKETWSDDFDFLFSLGVKIYTYIFDHNPNTKKLFPQIHAHGKNWKESPELRTQAWKFSNTLSMCIDLLDDMREMTERLRLIGENHVQFANRGFKPIYWNMSHEALRYALEDHLNSLTDFDAEKLEEAKEAWKHLSYFIVMHMKRGYVRKLVKDYQNQDEHISSWVQKHPTFAKITNPTSISPKNILIRYCTRK